MNNLNSKIKFCIFIFKPLISDIKYLVSSVEKEGFEVILKILNALIEYFLFRCSEPKYFDMALQTGLCDWLIGSA